VLPKADLHLHQEIFPRLERILARQQRRQPYAWHASAQRAIDTVTPGYGRLEAIYRADQTLGVSRELDTDRELFITRVADILTEAGADGAIYVELRFGADRLTALPDFMSFIPRR
jgi:adenosine deaminase